VSIRLILDSSALLAYVAGDVRTLELSELIANVEENGDICGIPALCVVESYRQVDADGKVKLLELASNDDGRTEVLPLLAADIARLADLLRRLPHDQAQAVVASEAHDALLGTYDRRAYADVVDEYEILDL